MTSIPTYIEKECRIFHCCKLQSGANKKKTIRVLRLVRSEQKVIVTFKTLNRKYASHTVRLCYPPRGLTRRAQMDANYKYLHVE